MELDNNAPATQTETPPPAPKPSKLQTVADTLRLYHADYPGYSLSLPSGRPFKEVAAALEAFKAEIEAQIEKPGN